MGRASLPVAALAIAGALAGCGGGGGGEGADTGGPGAVATSDQPRGDLIAGRDAFLIGTEPRCGDCHTLADAGTTATVGPDLDQVMPTFEQVMAAMEEGPGAMPEFPDVSMEVKENIAAYIEDATHQGG